MPVTVTAPSEALNVFARWNTGIVGLNPTRDMDVCLHFSMFMILVGNGLATSRSPVQGVLQIVCKVHSFRLILNGNRPEGIAPQEEEDLTFM
jgi:hypothetical protein